jgi:histone-lysine N-methyltransferase SETMAR
MQLKDSLKEKRRGKFTKDVLFVHDNASAHRALATQKKLAYLGFQCLDYPPYSPDLAPSDWTEETIERSPFFVDTVVIAAADTWLDGQPSEFFFFLCVCGLQKLEQRAKKRIELRGECVE